MAAGKVVSVFEEGGDVCLAVRVNERGEGDVEYIGRVPASRLEGLTAAEQKATLLEAVKAERQGPAVESRPAGMPRIRGSVMV